MFTGIYTGIVTSGVIGMGGTQKKPKNEFAVNAWTGQTPLDIFPHDMASGDMVSFVTGRVLSAEVSPNYSVTDGVSFDQASSDAFAAGDTDYLDLANGSVALGMKVLFAETPPGGTRAFAGKQGGTMANNGWAMRHLTSGVCWALRDATGGNDAGIGTVDVTDGTARNMLAIYDESTATPGITFHYDDEKVTDTHTNDAATNGHNFNVGATDASTAPGFTLKAPVYVWTLEQARGMKEDSQYTLFQDMVAD